MMVAPTQRIEAWNGLAINRDNNRVYLACAGGHGDWAGNEAYEIDLQADQPRWRLLRGPSPGNTISTDVDYYSDGRPSSTHLYYALHYVRSRGRIFKLSAGSNYGSGNKSNAFVDAFNLTNNDWDPQGTYTSAPAGGPNIDRPWAQHSETDDAYTFTAGAFRKWTSATAAWDTLAMRPSYANNDIVTGSASAVDTMRNQVLFAKNAYRINQRQGLLLTPNPSSTVTDVTYTGPHAATMAENGAGMEYVASEDAYFFKSRMGATVVKVNPMTFETSEQTTTGTAPPNGVNGVYTRWRYAPLLRGFVYLPSGSSNFWFLSTQ